MAETGPALVSQKRRTLDAVDRLLASCSHGGGDLLGESPNLQLVRQYAIEIEIGNIQICLFYVFLFSRDLFSTSLLFWITRSLKPVMM